MSSPNLQVLGDAFANIASAVTECVRADAHNSPSVPHAELIEQSIETECRRLRGARLEAIAGAIEAMPTIPSIRGAPSRC